MVVAIESEPKPVLGKPPLPRYGTVAYQIWKKWDELKKAGRFTAYEAKQIVKEHDRSRYGVDSSYSSVLSKWAREGYITLVTEGRGQIPAFYEIQN